MGPVGWVYLSDITNDGVVNMLDLAVFGGHWLETDCGFPGWCGGADFVRDGRVGLADIEALGEEWLGRRRGLGPIAHWRFDGNYFDSAGDHDGSAIDDPILATGNFSRIGSGAIEFDGVDDYIRVYGWKGILGGGARTVCAWIRTSTAGPGNIVMWGDAAGVGEWRFFAKGDLDGKLAVTAGAGYVVGTRNVCDGAWHHVAAVLENDGTPDAAEVRLYVDGVEDAITLSQSDAVDTSVGSDVLIGSNRVHYFDGLIDEVRIYDRALNGAEVGELAAAND
jgi:hypothetical protein